MAQYPRHIRGPRPCFCSPFNLIIGHFKRYVFELNTFVRRVQLSLDPFNSLNTCCARKKMLQSCNRKRGFFLWRSKGSLLSLLRSVNAVAVFHFSVGDEVPFAHRGRSRTRSLELLIKTARLLSVLPPLPPPTKL